MHISRYYNNPQYQILISFIAIILIGGGGFAMLQSDKGGSAEMQTILACKEKANDNECFEEKLIAIARKKGVKNSLAVLQNSKYTTPELFNNCHFPIAHELGEIGYHQYGLLLDALHAGGDPTLCTGGYYHGVVSEFMKHHADLATGEISKEACGDLEKTTSKERGSERAIWQCYHGIGHGLMIIEKNDLSKALTRCNSLSTRIGLQKACYYGALMENILQITTGPASTTFDKDSFSETKGIFSSCENLQDPYRHECYAVTPAYYLYLFSFGQKTKTEFLENPFDLCKAVPGDYGSYCAVGIGGTIGYAVDWDNKKITEYCLRAPTSDWRSSCFMGASIHSAVFSSEETNNDLCKNSPPEYRAACENAGADMFK